MRTFKSSNPAMRVMDRVVPEASAIPMTVQGTVNKTIILFLLTLVTATLTWKMAIVGNVLARPLMFVGLIGGLITAIITIVNPKVVNFTAPVYALFEGLLLGTISAVFAQGFYKAIVIQAVILTFSVFAVMLILYKFRIIKASAGFVKGLVMATMGIGLFYIISIILSFFRIDISVFAMGPFGIVIQLIIVAVAALNLILDFNFIEKGAAQGLPKKMEWYGAFGLIVTLIWLYLEILRLLAVISRR